jgi:valyl-tRNA synthetase
MNLPKTYDPKEYEDDIYKMWEASDAFKPVARVGEGKFSIVLPPPNANGDLHVGHSLMFALQDAVIRYHRMKGDETLWLPGADHAGFETQVTYEKHLALGGKSRFDFSREQLYDQIWDFVAKNRDNYETQFRRHGASVDWSRYVFTLDPKIIKRAYETFKKMWDEGLIYRGERLVNYCTFHQTGFADVEVAYSDATTPLYYMQYGPFELATTRPETKFGDTAVAVHPDDKRYAKYVGKRLTVEGVNGPFEVDVIADEMVDREFGTGVVKITPAHDHNDWEVAQRHNLPAVRVINHDGTMNEKAGRFRGLTVKEAREAVARALDEKGLLIKVDKHYKNRVGKCYKCGTIIEPMLMEQWFIDMQPLAKQAIAALKQDKIKFYPESKKDQLINYLENLRDWNISRQIAWGIPIPAFQNVDDTDDWIFDERIDQEIIEVDGKNYRRDPDVFDTWFSSSSWPYATLDYPEGKDYQKFYPNGLMETGGEILYPWVSRMIMLGLYVTGEVPFREVYIHGYVLAEDGAKMSKSVGNVINPMNEIDKYGSDALRLGLMAGRSPAVNRGYDHRKVEEARNFCNKLWNTARFIEGKIGDDFHLRHDPKPQTIDDEWMLTKLQQAIKDVSLMMEEYRFSEVSEYIYHLVWDDFADWYLEASKVHLTPGVLAYSLETILKLAHPVAPFVTETIWQTLKWENESLLITSPWPTALEGVYDGAGEFEKVKDVVDEIRFIQSSTGINRSKLIFNNDPIIASHGQLIENLANLAAVERSDLIGGLRLTSVNAWLDLDEKAIAEFLGKLSEQIESQKQSVKRLEARLSNKSYVKNAPAKLIEETKQQLTMAEQTLATLEESYSKFKV